MKESVMGVVVGLAAGTAGAFRWARHNQRPRLPIDIWRTVLRQTHGSERAAHLLARVETRYPSLVAARPLPRHPGLQRHLLNHVLPGLALYQTLLEVHAGNREAALAEIAMAFRAWTEAENRTMMRLYAVFPQPFALVRLAFALRSVSYPKEGWDFRTIENSPRRIAFDGHSCFYLETLATFGASELTVSFCQMDDWLAEMMPPQIHYHRTQTLGSGGECCDFRYEVSSPREERRGRLTRSPGAP